MKKSIFISFILLLLAFNGYCQINTDSTQYKNAMLQGQKYFKQQRFTDAIKSYMKALEYFPDEKEPKDKIASCHELIKMQDQVIQKEKQYADLIAKGDGCFVRKMPVDAKNYYKEACNIKPGEIYPQNRIKECDQMVANIALEAAYEKELLDALDFFNKENWIEAKIRFLDASYKKPDSRFCADKIEICDEKLKVIGERELKYTKCLLIGDSCWQAHDTLQAREFYTKALEVKDACVIHAKLAALEGKFICCEVAMEYPQAYVCACKKASYYIYTKRYEDAITAYEEALVIIPDSQYAKEQLKMLKKELKNKK